MQTRALELFPLAARSWPITPAHYSSDQRAQSGVLTNHFECDDQSAHQSDRQYVVRQYEEVELDRIAFATESAGRSSRQISFKARQFRQHFPGRLQIPSEFSQYLRYSSGTCVALIAEVTKKRGGIPLPRSASMERSTGSTSSTRRTEEPAWRRKRERASSWSLTEHNRLSIRRVVS